MMFYTIMVRQPVSKLCLLSTFFLVLRIFRLQETYFFRHACHLLRGDFFACWENWNGSKLEHKTWSSYLNKFKMDLLSEKTSLKADLEVVNEKGILSVIHLIAPSLISVEWSLRLTLCNA